MGKEKFKGVKRPFLLIANHASHLDAVVLVRALPWYVRRRLAVAAAADTFQHWDASNASLKERVARKAVTLLAILGLNIFPFQRYAGIKKSLEYSGQLMDRGWSVLIFPEGKLTRDGEMHEFKGGAGLLVREMNVPVVPAKIMGLYEILDYRSYCPMTFSQRDSYEDITRRLEQEVRFL
jgi:long-chain acyl-CoA synthetase